MSEPSELYPRAEVNDELTQVFIQARQGLNDPDAAEILTAQCAQIDYGFTPDEAESTAKVTRWATQTTEALKNRDDTEPKFQRLRLIWRKWRKNEWRQRLTGDD